MIPGLSGLSILIFLLDRKCYPSLVIPHPSFSSCGCRDCEKGCRKTFQEAKRMELFRMDGWMMGESNPLLLDNRGDWTTPVPWMLADCNLDDPRVSVLTNQMVRDDYSSVCDCWKLSKMFSEILNLHHFWLQIVSGILVLFLTRYTEINPNYSR